MDLWMEEAEHTVCFTGHRFIPASVTTEIRGLLENAITDAYAKGYTRFICGGALGFDTLAARSVLSFRTEHPEVRLLIAVPCADQDAAWNPEDRILYRKILDSADEVRVLSERYIRGCMQVRNRFMVDHSSLCIAWLTKLNGSGTMNTVRYALSQDRTVLNLAIGTNR